MFEVAEYTRFCKRCSRVLPITSFCKNRSAKFGYSYRCKECQQICNLEQKENRRKYYQARRKEDPAYLEIVKKAKHKYNRSVKGHQASKDSHDKFREKERIKGCKYYYAHKQTRIAYTHKWRLENPDKTKRYAKKSMANRNSNILVNMSNRIRLSLRKALIKNVGIKQGKTFDLLGYTAQELCEHLSAFVGKPCVRCGNITITLNNSHIDHIIPQISARTEEEVINIHALYNLRLICAKCNLSKGAKDE